MVEIIVPMIIVIVGFIIALYFILSRKETHKVPCSSKLDTNLEIDFLQKIKNLEKEMKEMETENLDLANKIKQLQQYQGIENEQVKYLGTNISLHSNNSSTHAK
jgi:hypothetical protein